jgi:hypothetical protein
MKRAVISVSFFGVAALLSACGSTSSSVKSTTTAASHQIAQFGGSGTGSTKYFKASEPWSLEWSVQCDSQEISSLIIQSKSDIRFSTVRVIHVKGVAMAGNSKWGSSGTFKLEVMTHAGCNWDLVVTEAA